MPERREERDRLIVRMLSQQQKPVLGIGVGMQADVSYGGKTYAGEVSAISPEVRQGEVTGRVRLREIPAGLRQNQRVSVRILMDRRDNVLKVERGGFYEAGGGATAFSRSRNCRK